MRQGKYWSFLTLLVLALLSPCTSSLGGYYAIQIESLRGLKGVHIWVESLASQIKKDGLTEELIRRDVASQLQVAGIRILSKEEWFDTEGSPYLYVNANVLKLQPTNEYIYSIGISLRQNVYPVRKPIEITGAATWSMGGIIGITSNLNKIRASVKDQIEEFIRVYLSVNPK